MVLNFVLYLLQTIVCVKVFHTLICPFWQGSEQTDWMTSLLLLQISWSFIRRPPWSQLPTWMYAYSSSPMSLKFMISYLWVKERAFTPQQPPSLLRSHFPHLPGESPFWSKWMVSPDTPVKFVFMRKSNSLRPSMGRIASHKPCRHIKSVTYSGSIYTQTHAKIVPCILDRGPPAWHADRKPWSKWHWWRSPSWCPVHTDGAETLSLWRKCTCLILAPHLDLSLCRT